MEHARARGRLRPLLILLGLALAGTGQAAGAKDLGWPRDVAHPKAKIVGMRGGGGRR